ncbi:PilN domain-containing protein [Desulforhopalus sp. IMCC35007]|uniref:PilN domain-containing protein n=1 Tax=Desulforhopalus sp. IMCC35007 TaxID=2569543 RepID=UPI0010AEE321|nr:PilN domain-containing protein [Desulforhopalus sp. IMCC35007]TKB12088.1 pilus assembly protein PilN [Desulforhopalus sp. IMCC35007]
MLKINLLPVRQLKRRAKARKQITTIFLFFLLLLAMLATVGFIQAQKISSLQDEVKQLNTEKNSYNKTLAEIAKLKKDREELTRKTDIIKQLKTDSSLTVRVLDEVANRIDNQRMWLLSLHQQESSLRLSGIALDNQTVAQFMDNLKESPFVTDVTLTDSSLKIISGKNLKSFELACSVAHPAPAEPKISEPQ